MLLPELRIIFLCYSLEDGRWIGSGQVNDKGVPDLNGIPVELFLLANEVGKGQRLRKEFPLFDLITVAIKESFELVINKHVSCSVIGDRAGRDDCWNLLVLIVSREDASPFFTDVLLPHSIREFTKDWAQDIGDFVYGKDWSMGLVWDIVVGGLGVQFYSEVVKPVTDGPTMVVDDKGDDGGADAHCYKCYSDGDKEQSKSEAMVLNKKESLKERESMQSGASQKSRQLAVERVPEIHPSQCDVANNDQTMIRHGPHSCQSFSRAAHCKLWVTWVTGSPNPD
ncbi:hypothetical protein ARMGADRAFT_1022449 [Armillaria gallica]|uniref:Uncharacterized protein n=1 Tax=Armillaria gallica TaxID=47427 RepID=A0A2H3EZS2_ARMGA|nr:hypothetical protein ARMGADRAFT_1022449 [Armillaria gallica]